MIDVMKTPIELPQRWQRRCYSGNKKRHTLKCQLVIWLETRPILCTFFGTGRQHNFKLFQYSGIRFHPATQSFQDKGCQGIQYLHGNSELLKKELPESQLSRADKADNRTLARKWIGIEHVNGRLKTFHALPKRYHIAAVALACAAISWRPFITWNIFRPLDA